MLIIIWPVELSEFYRPATILSHHCSTLMKMSVSAIPCQGTAFLNELK